MNVSRNNLTAADGSFLGYLFQIERVITWLSELSENDFVGVEVADDIVIQLTDGIEIQQIYEQAKHTVGSSAPYSDKSEDLWKTLSNWIEAVMDGKIDPLHAKFSLLSNKPLLPHRFVIKLSNASLSDSSALDTCCAELIQNASQLRPGLQEYGQRIISCPINILKQIVNNIVVLDANYNHNKRDYLNQIKQKLHLSDDLPVDHIVEKLFGFVSAHLIDKWRKKEAGWISVKAFNQQFTQLIAEYKKKPFIEKTTDLLPVSKSEVKKNLGKVYVEQLKIIDCQDDEVLEAIHDYLRALSERDRFAKDGEISSEKFDQYFDDLLENWKVVSKPRFKFASEDQHLRVGYEVYYETLKYRGKLNNFEPQQHYTYRGAYHYLSNELNLGWHPKWKQILSK